MPLFVSDFLDICDPVLTFDRFMEEINLEKYLKNVPFVYGEILRICGLAFCGLCFQRAG